MELRSRMFEQLFFWPSIRKLFAHVKHCTVKAITQLAVSLIESYKKYLHILKEDHQSEVL